MELMEARKFEAKYATQLADDINDWLKNHPEVKTVIGLTSHYDHNTKRNAAIVIYKSQY